MTLALSDTRAPSALGVHERLVRGVLFLACFLLATLTASPFPDLGNPALLDPIGEGSRLGQISDYHSDVNARHVRAGEGAMGCVSRPDCGACPHFVVVCRDGVGVGPFRSWRCGGSCLRSSPSPTRPRYSCCRLTANTSADFSPLAHWSSLRPAISACCLVPHLSIHQATDVIESALAGAWRGPFGHKNGAGAMMVVLIFAGFYVARAVNLMLGLVVIAGAAIFLPFTAVEIADRAFPVRACSGFRSSLASRRGGPVRSRHRSGAHRQPSDRRHRRDRAGGQADRDADARFFLYRPR